MKFLRKVLALCLAIVFLIALVIGAGIILSVQNVNVRYVYYGENEHSDDYAETRLNLDTLKGTGLLFISREDLESKIVNGDVLALESYEKVYPCTINVVIRERTETFAVKSENGGYSVYDEAGALIKTAATPLNSDGSPNVVVEGTPESSMGDVARICGYFRETFSSFRRLVESVSVSRISEYETFEFLFRSGFKIRIYGWNSSDSVNGDKIKIEKAYEKYSSLTDVEKLDGVIDVIADKDGGEPSVIYPGYSGV